MTEQLALPPSLVNKLLKSTAGDSVSIAASTRMMASQSAGVFVLYLTSIALDRARGAKRSTISADDVLAASAELGLDEVHTVVATAAEGLKAEAQGKRARTAPRISDPASTSAAPASPAFSSAFAAGGADNTEDDGDDEEEDEADDVADADAEVVDDGDDEEEKEAAATLPHGHLLAPFHNDYADD